MEKLKEEMRTAGGKRSTRERLLEAAGELFAEKGFQETHVKDITDRAGANVAAVNYYFRDKESLYEEVIQYIFEYMRKNFPLEKGLAQAHTPEECFSIVIRNLLYRFMSPARPSWQGMLLAQERMNPKPSTVVVINEEITKTRSLILDCIKNLLGPEADPEYILFCHESLVAQILHQAHIRSPHAPPIVRRNTATLEEIDHLAQQITVFSLAGIRHIQCSSHCRSKMPKEDD